MYQDHKIDWKNWKREIKEEFKIIHVTDLNEIRGLVKKGGLLCSRCSKIKDAKIEEAVPNNFYLSYINKNFYKWCDFFGFEYGILSDLYGLHYWDESLKKYDIHPSSLNEEDFKKLAKLISNKMKKRKYKSFIFYNISPIMSNPYFYMMYLTGYPIYFVSKLPVNKLNVGLK